MGCVYSEAVKRLEEDDNEATPPETNPRGAPGDTDPPLTTAVPPERRESVSLKAETSKTRSRMRWRDLLPRLAPKDKPVRCCLPEDSPTDRMMCHNCAISYCLQCGTLRYNAQYISHCILEHEEIRAPRRRGHLYSFKRRSQYQAMIPPKRKRSNSKTEITVPDETITEGGPSGDISLQAPGVGTPV